MKIGGNNIRLASVVRIIGRLLMMEALMMVIPLLVSLLYGESDWKGFAVAVGGAAISGSVMESAARRHDTSIRGREGFIITALVWIVFGCFGAIPLMMSRIPLGFTDAFFEMISGFTTTGASVITDVEVQSHGVLLWRALSQWIGGLGIILFMLAVLPEFNKSVGISMFNAEATGIVHGKLHPRIRQTALSLWGVYVVITIAAILLMWAGPMNLFDSVCQSFATVATGGFSTRNAGIGYWKSDYLYCVVTVMMFVAGLNFMNIYSASRRGIGVLWRSDVFRAFCMVVAGGYGVYFLSAVVSGEDLTLDRFVVYPLFHVMSAVTSTGFSISEVEYWGPTSMLVTLLLMICGSCCGSTSGGIKIDRLLVLGRNFRNEITRTVFPKRAYVVTLEGGALDTSLVSRIYAFVTIYLLTIVGSTLVITFYGYGFADAIFMSASCMGCNGLGYGVTGAEGGFALLPDMVKWLLTAVMLVGRLELFTFLVLMLPSFWRR